MNESRNLTLTFSQFSRMAQDLKLIVQPKNEEDHLNLEESSKIYGMVGIGPVRRGGITVTILQRFDSSRAIPEHWIDRQLALVLLRVVRSPWRKRYPKISRIRFLLDIVIYRDGVPVEEFSEGVTL